MDLTLHFIQPLILTDSEAIFRQTKTSLASTRNGNYKMKNNFRVYWAEWRGVKAASFKMTKTLIRKKACNISFPLTSLKKPLFHSNQSCCLTLPLGGEGNRAKAALCLYDPLISCIRPIRLTRTVAPGAAQY